MNNQWLLSAYHRINDDGNIDPCGSNYVLEFFNGENAATFTMTLNQSNFDDMLRGLNERK